MAIGPDRRKLHAIINFGGKYIYQDINDGTKFNAVCDKSAKDLLRQVLIVVPLVIISYAQISIGAFYAYFVHGILTTPMGTLLPFTNDDSRLCFIINTCHQIFIAVFATLGSAGIEICACMINNVVTLTPKLILLNVEELENDLISDGWTLKTKSKLRNILIQIQDFDR